MKNQRGFVLPLTMIMSFILLFFTVHAILSYQYDRSFAQKRAMSFELNELIQMATVDLEKLAKEDHIESSGKLVYTTGNVQYHTNKVNGTVWKIAMIATNHEGFRHSNTFYYDSEKGGIVKWAEGA